MSNNSIQTKTGGYAPVLKPSILNLIHTVLFCSSVFVSALHQVLRSIGYKGIPIDETFTFDAQRGIIPNTNGRVDGCPGVSLFFDYLLFSHDFGSACNHNNAVLELEGIFSGKP